MKIKSYEIKRRCKNPKFLVIVSCQGQPFYYMHHTIVGAISEYIRQYVSKSKYGTMTFKLRQVMLHDEF